MIKIKDEIYWVGIRDWEVRRFHGEEYSTHRGSSYNSYLIKDEKIALVDNVWSPFQQEYLEELEREVGLKNIDMIIVNHAEPDHGGSLGLLMEKIPDTPIYCTANGAKIIQKHFHKDWDFKIVKTGDTVDLGKNKLVFLEMRMLHWPDSMATFVSGANVLLSNDAFGQHYAAPQLFNDLVDQCELYQEAIKYYANILTPFSKLVSAKLKEVGELNLPIEMIAPSHGVIWRDNPMQILEKYHQWANNYHEGTAVVLYNTMYGSTQKMAMAIAKGLENKGVVTKVINIGKSDHGDIITDIFKAKGVVIGSCTLNRGVLGSTGAITTMIKGLQFKEKYGAAFGSYGWGGESIKIVANDLEQAGFELVGEGLKVQYAPTVEELEKCVAFGEAFADKIQG